MRKIVIQNLAITILSKLFSFLSFVFIAKFLTESEYGGFTYILMVLSLVPMIQLGSVHGTAILLPKFIVKKNKSENKLFIYSNFISHFLQFIAFVAVFFIELGLSKFDTFIIGLNFFLFLFSDNAIKYLNAKHDFQQANIINAVNQISRPVLVLFLFFQYKTISSIFIGHFIVSLFTLILAIKLVKVEKIKFNKIEFIFFLKSIYKIGFFVYLTWTIDIVFRTADRWFISFYYSLEELALYGFTSSLSLNVWLVSMSFFVPYTQVLYRYVAEKKFGDVDLLIKSTNKKLYLLLLILSVLAFVFYPLLLELIVKKYSDSEFLFYVLIISSIMLAINNMYIYYMISNNHHFVLLKYQCIVLILNLFLNSVFVYFHLNIIYYAYSTIFTLGVYFLLVRRFTKLDLKKKINI